MPRAMRCTPIASAMVTMPAGPRGSRHRERDDGHEHLVPRLAASDADDKASTARAAIGASNSRLKWAILRVSGVCTLPRRRSARRCGPSRSDLRWRLRRPRPQSVGDQRADKARLCGRPGLSRWPAAQSVFSTGRDSPVSAASSIRKRRCRRRAADRPAHGRRIPASTTSPGTSCAEGTRSFSPPRRTVASVTTIFASAPMASSALASWMSSR